MLRQRKWVTRYILETKVELTFPRAESNTMSRMSHISCEPSGWLEHTVLVSNQDNFLRADWNICMISLISQFLKILEKKVINRHFSIVTICILHFAVSNRESERQISAGRKRWQGIISFSVQDDLRVLSFSNLVLPQCFHLIHLFTSSAELSISALPEMSWHLNDFKLCWWCHVVFIYLYDFSQSSLYFSVNLYSREDEMTKSKQF